MQCGFCDTPGIDREIRIACQQTLELLGYIKKIKKKSGKPPIRFRLSIPNYWRDKGREHQVWEDDSEQKLEGMLPNIAEEIILAGERHYRAHKEYQYQSMMERKQELEEAERQRVETEARLEKERIENLKQQRIQKLLDEAAAYRQACDIREYVSEVLASIEEPTIQDQLTLWADWARAQADGLDPIVSGVFQIDEIPS